MNTTRRFIVWISIVLAIVFVGCKDDKYPSNPRDGIYAGENLTVTLNKIKVSSVKSATLKSVMSSENGYIDNQGNIVTTDTSYRLTIKIDGFSTHGDSHTIKSVCRYDEFNGETAINGKLYKFAGKLTGDIHDIHDELGLIINFNKKPE